MRRDRVIAFGILLALAAPADLLAQKKPLFTPADLAAQPAPPSRPSDVKAAPATPTPPAAPGGAPKPLTNDDVVAMVRASLPAGIIEEKIRNSPAAFSLETPDLVALTKAGVPESVVRSMIVRGSAPAPAAGSGPGGPPASTPGRVDGPPAELRIAIVLGGWKDWGIWIGDPHQEYGERGEVGVVFAIDEPDPEELEKKINSRGAYVGTLVTGSEPEDKAVTTAASFIPLLGTYQAFFGVKWKPRVRSVSFPCPPGAHELVAYIAKRPVGGEWELLPRYDTVDGRLCARPEISASRALSVPPGGTLSVSFRAEIEFLREKKLWDACQTMRLE